MVAWYRTIQSLQSLQYFPSMLLIAIPNRYFYFILLLGEIQYRYSMYIPVPGTGTGTRLPEMCPRSAIDCPTISHQELQDSCWWQLRPSELQVDSMGGTAGCFLGFTGIRRCAETTKNIKPGSWASPIHWMRTHSARRGQTTPASDAPASCHPRPPPAA